MQSWYRRIGPIDRNQHADLRIMSKPNFSFTADTVSVPVCLNEFLLAAAHYPILFTNGDEPNPVALLGLRSTQNLFVNAEGDWQPDAYIPAAVRIYPFVMLNAGEGREVLGADLDSPLFTPVAGVKLFEGGEPTDALNQALQLSGSYRQAMVQTTEFAKALKKAGVLEEHEATVDLPTLGEKIRLNGFSVVNAEKLDKLPDKTFIEWRRKFWLGPIYQHLQAGAQWRHLISLAAQRPPVTTH